MGATREAFLEELETMLDAYTRHGGNTIGDEHVTDATIIEEPDESPDTISVEFESGARFFLSIEEV